MCMKSDAVSHFLKYYALNNLKIIVKAYKDNFMSITYHLKQLFYIFVIGMSVESSNKYSNKERAMCR